MYEVQRYVPILSPKMGEFRAIKQLNVDALKRITPLFDIHRIPIVKGKSVSYKDHLDKIIKNLLIFWPREKTFLLDSSNINLKLTLDSGLHPIGYVCSILNENGMVFCPTIGTDRDQNYIEAIRDHHVKTVPNSRINIRLLREDFINFQETSEQINRIVEVMDINHDRCNLILDFKNINENEIENLIDVMAELNQFIVFDNWASFIISSSGFPKDMSGIERDSHFSIKRLDYLLWKTAYIASPLIGGKPIYSDYCISHSEKPNVDPAMMKAAGKIRYTTKENWEIFKGHGVLQQDKFEQYRILSNNLIKSAHYMGEEFSWGDKYVINCANGLVGTGNLEVWVRVDTNHHLTLVSEQVANFDEFLKNN